MNPAGVHMLLQFLPDLVVYRVEIGASQKVITRKSGVSRVNSCSVSRAISAGTLFLSRPESGPVAALFNTMKTARCCRRYLTVKEYYLTKFCGLSEMYLESSA